MWIFFCSETSLLLCNGLIDLILFKVIFNMNLLGCDSVALVQPQVSFPLVSDN